VIVSVAIRALGNVLEAVIVELPQEARVALVAEVLLTNVLFKHYGDRDAKGAAVRQKTHVFAKFFVGKHVVNFFRKTHVLDLLWWFIVEFRRNLREVAVSG
jgi:hypothetical protein